MKEIIVKFVFDEKHWEDYKDIHPDIQMDDALRDIAPGVLFQVQSSIPFNEPGNDPGKI